MRKDLKTGILIGTAVVIAAAVVISFRPENSAGDNHIPHWPFLPNSGKIPPKSCLYLLSQNPKSKKKHPHLRKNRHRPYLDSTS